MPILVLRLPCTPSTAYKRPEKCPYCGGRIIQRWGSAGHRCQKLENNPLNIYRYRCCGCDRTFQDSFSASDPSSQIGQMRNLGAIMYGLGMSYRQVEEFFARHEIHLSRMTVWRNWQVLLLRTRERNPSVNLDRFLIDRVYVHKISNKLGVVVVVDFGQGKLEVLGTLNADNPREVKSWLDLLTCETGIKVSIGGTAALEPIYAYQPGD